MTPRDPRDRSETPPSDPEALPEPSSAPAAPLVPGRYDGPARAAPYALSRLAPAFDLVDLAREIERADATLANVAEGKLALIAKQMRALKEEAAAILARGRRDAFLHRVACSFEKKIGGVVHLYRRDDGGLWFSLLAPHEWTTKRAQTFVASYRLEPDMSFSLVDGVEVEVVASDGDLER